MVMKKEKKSYFTLIHVFIATINILYNTYVKPKLEIRTPSGIFRVVTIIQVLNNTLLQLHGN